MSRKSGNTGHRLSKTRAASKQISARQSKSRKSSRIEVRFVCPECGGPHSKADHGVRLETPGPVKAAKKRRRSGVPQSWTNAERAIIDDAMNRRVP